MLSEMSWFHILVEPEAGDLPPDLRRLDHPLVLWYPSAARDFRPLVFTTPSYQARLSARIGEPLRLVAVSDGAAAEPHYVRRPFAHEPDFGATSVTYRIADLLSRSGASR